MSARTDFQIDDLNLREEWLRQADLYFSYAEKAATARSAYDAAAQELSVVEADLSLDIRANPRHYDLDDKVTEAAVKSTLFLQKGVRRAQKIVREAKHDLDIAQAACTALEHKKRALTMLVELNTAKYFADPKITASSEMREAAQDEEKRRIRNKGKVSRWRDEDRGSDDD